MKCEIETDHRPFHFLLLTFDFKITFLHRQRNPEFRFFTSN